MRDYEIQYLHSDGSLSLLYKTACQDDANARRGARQMMPDNCARYEIWSDDGRVSDDTEQQQAAYSAGVGAVRRPRHSDRSCVHSAIPQAVVERALPETD